MKILESYKKIAKSMLIEHAWDRKFGEALPTLEDVMNEADVKDKKIKFKDKDDNDKEATVGGILKKGEKHPAYDDAKAMIDKGGDKKSDAGKLGGGDYERDFDDSEPEDKPFGGDTGADADSETGKDYVSKFQGTDEPEGGEEPEGTDNSAALKKIKRKDLNKLSGGDAWEKDFYSDDDIFLGSPDYEQEEGDAYWESPDLDGLSRATDHTTLKQKFFDLHAYRSTLQSRIEMADDEGDTEEVAKLQKDWMKAAKQQNNIVGMMKPQKPQFKGMSGRSSYGGVGIRDSVTINGKKYKEVKEEKKVTEKHILREMYEKIGGK